MAQTMHCEPKRKRRLGQDVGIGDGGGVEADLVGAGEKQRPDIGDGPDAAADGQRHEALLGGAGGEVVERAAILVAGVDVEKAQLVRARCVVGAGAFDRIAGIDQVDEVHALDHAAVGDVEAGDDPGLEHGQTDRGSGGFGKGTAQPGGRSPWRGGQRGAASSRRRRQISARFRV